MGFGMLKVFYIYIYILLTCLNFICMTQTREDIFVDHAANDKQGDVEKLIKEGIDINAKNSEGFTALMKAAINNKRSMVDKLIKAKADLEIKNTKGETVIETCSGKSLHDIVELLAVRGADADKVQNPYMRNWAKRGQDIYIMFENCKSEKTEELLVSTKNWYSNYLKDINRFTPLHYAMEDNNPKLVKDLLSAVPELIKIPDPKSGLMPREMAQLKGAKEILETFDEFDTLKAQKEDLSIFGYIGSYVQANKAKSLAVAVASGCMGAIILKLIKNYLNKPLVLSTEDAINLDPKKLKDQRIIFKKNANNKK